MGRKDVYESPLHEPMVSDSSKVAVGAQGGNDLADDELKSPGFYLCNVVHMSSCFLLVFTAFSAIQNLAGTYLFKPLGFIQGTVLYATFAVSCLFGPLVGSKLGAKWSLFCGFIGYMLYAAAAMVTGLVFVDTSNASVMPKEACINGSEAFANFTLDCHNTEAGWAIELTGAALCGFCASFLWYAEGKYITKSANKYRDAVVRQSQGQKSPKDAKGLFNGIFFAMFQLTQISGNLLAGILFSTGWTFPNVCIVYLVCATAGTIVCFFLRPVNSAAEREEEASKSVGDRIKGPVALLIKDMRLPLLVCYMVYSGMEMVFMWSDFTSNYVQPNDLNIGYVTAVFGAVDAVSSAIVGKVSDVVGQWPMVYLGLAAQAAVLVVLEYDSAWKDNAALALYICAAAWGIGDSVANTVMYSIIGGYFSDEEVGDAFANLKLWQSIACALAFTYSRAPGDEAVQMRRYGVFAAIVVSAITYGILAVWQRKKKQVSPQPISA